MKHPSIMLSLAVPLALAACAADPPLEVASTEQHAQECEEEDCPPEGPMSCEACDETRSCNAECLDVDLGLTTCAEAGQCQPCAVCGPDVPCADQCVEDDGDVTTCATQKPLCLRFDVYCAMPVITETSISDTHEGGLGWPFDNGPFAYMYFRNSGGVKHGHYPREVGGMQFDPEEAWASNFRGPIGVPGDRTQWEWVNPDNHAVSYPYVFDAGDRCAVVPAGSSRPVLTDHTESVFEDDESLNPDDHVGDFTFERSRCDDVFAGDAEAAFSDVIRAPVTGSLRFVDYRLWCYACLDSMNDSCSTGVVW